MSITWARFYTERNVFPVSESVPTTAHAHWNGLDQGWICLNVDGAVSNQSGLGTIAGVFRDYEGSWMLDFNKKIDVTRPLQGAIYISLQVYWEKGFEVLSIQTDSLEAVHSPPRSNRCYV
ncbi:hypothetical protein F3Y22_tig00110332pilonHSYRG00991 [Hibiscus syriacus]|uniref:RNase H type-1 domain-containing protein n=1 Tax=Hibiscus syriacus TaxID=106335 RepID=A0A6A3AWK8_HIBSY|nr:hypothetical protein F3Y22_tig00110332pilonHSYRG00991 [Hibiscus syriacus]